MLDLVIKNGRIVDGTGNSWFFGDVAVKDGVIVRVGSVDEDSRQVVDAGKQVIAPGFIDGHTHSDLMILEQPHSQVKMQQGVTTEVVGNCGLAPAPFFPERAELLQTYVEPVIGRTDFDWPWQSVGQYMDYLAQSNPAENVATYVAHGALRIAVMGFEKRAATSSELAVMKELLEEGMKAGAIGLSIGLLYAPGSYTSREEIAELCSLLPKYGGILATHIRGEGNNLLPSIQEVIWIAERSGIPLHVCHLKAAGRINWGKIQTALGMIEDARSRGMDVTCDVYPYSAGSTSLTTVLPPWVLEGGIGATLERLRTPSVRQRLKEELAEEQTDWDNLVASTGWQSIFVSSVDSAGNKPLEGKHILDISAMRGLDPVDCMLDLLLEEDGKVAIVYFHMSDQDVEQVVAYDHSIIISDSLGCVTGKPHPRTYGTFPRLFARYVREKKLLSLEQAVRKVTSFPAQRFKLGKRGLLVPGYHADLVVFDPDTITDGATFENPTGSPAGITSVWVNGVNTMNHAEHTSQRPGVLIRSQCCNHH
ncbi:N-acyl-D-amino-acid deacylase family protein [Paenibacillus nasutitermitis]|uniref:Aminoacylase n=1 Tax=Paenibacillus nasutitermitis TaxID=1652958 RepID=A0A917DV40_9BACL|nr:D-aminoacylase [Paenibacillus nasutitermitis]GGD73496.1 aminoacylase [Paenibacillus nasutitermitis]